MKKHIKQLLSLSLIAMTLTLSISACGGSKTSSSDPSGEEDNSKNELDISNLEDGKFYVMHNTKDSKGVEKKTFEPLYFGNGTFKEGSTTTTNKDNSRVLWYKDDFKKIPTLYYGDSLIMYTESVLDETFNFERFEDFGYSIGLCGLTKTASGRYQIKTSADANTTYPDSDASAINNLSNATVIVDSVGSMIVRADLAPDGNTSDDKSNYTSSRLTRIGTIKDLNRNGIYNVLVYEGTVQHEYNMKADVEILGSMEDVQTNDYEFIDKKILNVDIPKYFQRGYYLVNGQGLFRYYDDASYNGKVFNVDDIKKTNDFFNNPNMTTTDDQSMQETSGAPQKTVDSSTKSPITTQFEVKEPGVISLVCKFTKKDKDGNDTTEGVDISDAIVIVYAPNEPGGLQMTNDSNGNCSITFNAEKTGTYTIRYYSIGDMTPHISAAQPSEEDIKRLSKNTAQTESAETTVGSD